MCLLSHTLKVCSNASQLMRIKALGVIPLALANISLFLTSPSELHLLVETIRYHQVMLLCSTAVPIKTSLNALDHMIFVIF